MHKKLLLILFLMVTASSGSVKYLVYEINNAFTKIDKYEISLESQAPDFNLIKGLTTELTTERGYPSYSELFDTLFPGQYYIHYQVPGDGGWIDFISNTNPPKKLVTLNIDLMCASCVKDATILGNKLKTVFTTQKVDNEIKINNILINGIFDTLNSADSMKIDTLLFEQSIKENIAKIKEMDVVKINHIQDPSANILVYTVLILLDDNLPVSAQNPNIHNKSRYTNSNVYQRYFNINGKMIGKKMTLSKGAYIGTSKNDNFKASTVLIK